MLTDKDQDPNENSSTRKKNFFSIFGALGRICFIALLPLVLGIYGYQWMTGMVIASVKAPGNDSVSVKVREIPVDRLPSLKRNGFKISFERVDSYWYRLENWQSSRFHHTCITYFSGNHRVKDVRIEWLNEHACAVYFDNKLIGYFDNATWKPK